MTSRGPITCRASSTAPTSGVRAIPHPAPAPDRAPGQPAEEETKANPDARRSSSGFVKVDTAKLDSLVDLVGELVIAQSLVTQDADLRSQPLRVGRHLAQRRRRRLEQQVVDDAGVVRRRRRARASK